MKKESWVVAANSVNARLFRLEKLKLVEMDALVHPESRLHEKDLVADKPGLTFESFGPGARFPMGQQQSPKKTEAVIFAKQVGERLELARARGEIERLYIAASPSFLGLLRQELSDQTADLIESEVAKDITQLKPDEILKYFPIGL